jgi:hypothetical protein
MHQCPGGCGNDRIASNRFACRACWYRLPAQLRAAVWEGYRQQPLGEAHRAAMADAREWYRNNAVA